MEYICANLLKTPEPSKSFKGLITLQNLTGKFQSENGTKTQIFLNINPDDGLLQT